MAKYAALGATLTINSLVIPQVRSISSSGGETERVDVTTLDSTAGFREFLASWKGEMQVTFEIVYDPGETDHQSLATLYGSGAVVTCSLGLPSTPAKTISFSAFVALFQIPQLQPDGAMTTNVTLQLSGAPTWPS